MSLLGNDEINVISTQNELSELELSLICHKICELETRKW